PHRATRASTPTRATPRPQAPGRPLDDARVRAHPHMQNRATAARQSDLICAPQLMIAGEATAAPIGGSACVLPGHLRHLAVSSTDVFDYLAGYQDVPELTVRVRECRSRSSPACSCLDRRAAAHR